MLLTSIFSFSNKVFYRSQNAGLIPGPIFFPWIGDSQQDTFLSHLCPLFQQWLSATVGKQPVAWKEYCAEYCLNELQESMDRCAGRRDITEILL